MITDYTHVYHDLRASVEADYAKVDAENSRLFMWTSLSYYLPFQLLDWHWSTSMLEKIGGPFEFSHEAPRPAIKV